FWLNAECYLPTALVRARGLIFRFSTGLELRHLLSRLKHLNRGRVARRSQPAVQLLHIRPGPAYAGEFNLTLRRYQKECRHVSKAVGVGDGIFSRWVEHHRKGHAELAVKGLGVRGIVLGNADKGKPAFLFVSPVNTVMKRQGHLAHRAAHLKK